MSNQNIEFCGKLLGPSQPPFIVAEVGFNHNGDVELAKKMIESAAKNEKSKHLPNTGRIGVVSICF